MSKICYISTIADSVRAFLIPQLKYLAENGFDVTVICSPDDALQAELGYSVRFIPVEIARGIYPLTLKKSISELRKIFIKNKFDIVQYLTPNASFVASIAAKMAKIKVRNYYQVGFRYLGAKGIFKQILKAIEKYTCKFSTHIECVSQSNVEFGIKEKLFTREKAYIIWNGSAGGVDLNRFNIKKREEWRKEIRQKLGYTDTDFVFGFIGRITKDKGINELLSAFSQITSPAKLLVVGPAEGIDTLNQELYISAKANDNITFHGSVRDVEKYYSAVDVLVLPSYREGFGMVIIEAAAVGTPAIISDIPGPVDAVIPGKTAKLVKLKDANHLKNVMEEFLQSKELTKTMSKNAYEFVATHFDNREFNKKVLDKKHILLEEK